MISKNTQQTQSENPKKVQSTIQAALAQFDDLPDSAYVRQPVVLGLFGCSKATLWRWVKLSRIPSPQKIGSRISAWNVGQLRQTLRQLDTSKQTSTMAQ